MRRNGLTHDSKVMSKRRNDKAIVMLVELGMPGGGIPLRSMI
jgi:hypothetical protein